MKKEFDVIELQKKVEDICKLRSTEKTHIRIGKSENDEGEQYRIEINVLTMDIYTYVDDTPMIHANIEINAEPGEFDLLKMRKYNTYLFIISDISELFK